MKKAILFLLCLCFLFSGCGKTLPPASILRDEERTGGSFSFVYDSSQKTIFVGGQDEIIQFSSENIEKGFKEGCRIGLKISAPNEDINLNQASLKIAGVTYSKFFEKINGISQRFFYIYPEVSEMDKEVDFSITWQNGASPQKYKLKVLEGTKIMQKDGKFKVVK